MIHLSGYTVIVTAASGDGDASNIGLVFLLSGFVFYGIMFLVYRNVDKRHHYARETEATKHDVKAADERVRSLKGLSNSRMRGANNTEVRGAPNSMFGGALGALGGLAGQVTRSLGDQDRKS